MRANNNTSSFTPPLPPTNESTNNKRWLREASMKRLNMLIKNKKESIGDGFIASDINADELEASGLNHVERFHVGKWMDGNESGRHCLLALLESRAIASAEGLDPSSSSMSGKKTSSSRPMEMTMLSSTISLPDDFLCDSGYLYDKVFSRPPQSVVREALQLLAAKAMEKTSATLKVDQINLALKQLRVEKLSKLNSSGTSSKGSSKKSSEKKAEDKGVSSSSAVDDEGDNKENETSWTSVPSESDLPLPPPPPSTAPDTATDSDKAENKNSQQPSRSQSPETIVETETVAPQNRELERFRLQILVELIRRHIAGANNSNPPSRSNSISGSDKPDVPSLSTTTVNPSTGAVEPSLLDVDSIEEHLDVPLTEVSEQAEAQDPVQLEAANTRLKPYLRQLNALKAHLTTQLKELEDSRAFIALGISKEASEAVIKKAYHSKAIKLHPDKPGGDTAKFQKLQESYHEILKKKAEAAALDREMRGGEEEDDEEEDEEEKKDEEEKQKKKDKKKEKKRSPAECEAEKAAHVVEGLGEVLEQVSEVADQCAKIGQLALKWQKRMDKACKLNFPENLVHIYKILKEANNDRDKDKGSDKDGTSTTKEGRSRMNRDAHVLECSALLAIPPVERVCELMQTLSSLAMELPSSGFRYGLATAASAGYMKVVESAMGAGLDAIKSVGALMSAEQQLGSSVARLKEAKKFVLGGGYDEDTGGSAGDEGMGSVLVQMMAGAMRTNTAAVGEAAERVVGAALVAQELFDAAQAIVSQAGEEVKADAKRNVQRKEAEMDMCEEDRVFMAQRRAQEREDDSKRYAEEMKRREEERRKEREEEGADTVEKLRGKIKSLQVQLRVQNVQALQTLNVEARALQRTLQQQLKELMINSTQDGEVFSTTSSTTATPSNSGKGGAGAATAPLPPFRASLLSLLADFVDGSCNEMRADLQASLATSSSSSASPSSSSSSSSSSSGKDAMTVLRRHLGWMRDLRGQKKVVKAPAAAETPSTDAATDTPKPTTASSSSGSCFDIDEDTVPTDSGGEDVVQGEEDSEHGHDEKKSSSGAADGGSTASGSSSSVAGAEDTATTPITADDKSTTRSTGDGNDGGGAVESKGDDTISNEESQTKPPAESDAESASTIADDNGETPRRKFTLPSMEEGSDDEEEDQEVSEQGVRLALLPDIRSRALWLAALVDPEGVSSLVGMELRTRLREIFEASDSQSQGAASSSGSNEALTAVERFCIKVSRGAKAAAAGIA